MSATPGLNLFDGIAFGDSVNTQSINGANKRVAGIYTLPKAGTLTYIGFLTNSFTAAGDVDVRLEGVSAGLPDGTLVAAGASAAPTVSAAGWTWQALGTPPTVTAGQAVAAVVAFKTSSTINAVFGYNISNSRTTQNPYACQDNGTGTWSIAANVPTTCLKYSDGTIVLGGCPMATFAIAAFASGTNPNERAAVFTPAFDCTLTGVRLWYFPDSRTTSTWEVNVYSGTGTSPVSGGTLTGNPAIASTIFAARSTTRMFPTPVSLTGGTTYRLALKALGAGNVNLPRFTWSSTAERDACVGALWSDTRNGGAWIGANTLQTEAITPLLDTVTAGGGGSTNYYGAHVIGG